MHFISDCFDVWNGLQHASLPPGGLYSICASGPVASRQALHHLLNVS
jgi:hypothetical protein